MSAPNWEAPGAGGTGSGPDDGGSDSGSGGSGHSDDPRRDPDNWDGSGPEDDSNPGSDWDDPDVDPPASQDPSNGPDSGDSGSGGGPDDGRVTTWTIRGLQIPVLEERNGSSYYVDIPSWGKTWVNGKSTVRSVIDQLGIGEGDDPRRDPDNWDGTPRNEDPNPGSDWDDPDVDPPAPQDPDDVPGAGGGSPQPWDGTIVLVRENSDLLAAGAAAVTLGGLAYTVVSR